jgi:hypothetical protein
VSAPITDAQLAAWQALADAATPGPWECGPTKHDAHETTDVFTHEAHVYPPLGECGPVACVSEGEPGTAAFIAAAREAVPALVTRVRALEALLAAAHDELRHADASMADRVALAAKIGAAVPAVDAAWREYAARVEAEEREEDGPCVVVFAPGDCEDDDG